MSIKKGEWEKLFRNPVLIVLTGIFLIYNFILINDNSYIKEGLEETNKLISQVGYKVDEDMLKKLEDMYDEKMKDLNELTERKLHKTFESMDEFLANKDFHNWTYEEKGRNLIKDKAIVGLSYSILAAIIILGITLIVYFSVFDYSKIWNVPISSALNWEVGPHISWYNFTVLQNLLLSIGVVLIISLISGGISLSLCLFLKSSYKAFFAFFILFGGLFMLPGLFSMSSKLVIWSYFNIFVLTLNPQKWFAEAGALLTSKYYIEGTLISNGVIVTIISLILIKRFKKVDIL